MNRVWANFMGVGLVEAVDDMRKTNPASNEKLLEALANYLTRRYLLPWRTHPDGAASGREILQTIYAPQGSCVIFARRFFHASTSP